MNIRNEWEKILETRRSPLRAVKAKCLECMGGDRNEAEQCTAPDCPLYSYRLGKDRQKAYRPRTEAQQRASLEAAKSLRPMPQRKAEA